MTSLIESEVESSFVIVPWPAASEIEALDGLLRLTVNVSLFSTLVSPFTWTVMVFVSPAVPVKLSVPEFAT